MVCASIGFDAVQEESGMSDIIEQLRAENEKLKAALRSGVEMRRRQKVYFKERTSARLVESKQSEASFDRMAAEALEGRSS